MCKGQKLILIVLEVGRHLVRLLATSSHQEQKGPNKDKLCSQQAEEQSKLTLPAVFIASLTHLRAERSWFKYLPKTLISQHCCPGAKFSKSKFRRRHSNQFRICFQLAQNVIRCSTVLGYASWIQKHAYFSPNMAI